MLLKDLLIKIVRFYQKVFSPDRGILRALYPNNKGHCRMYPPCSEYMILSIQKYGVFKGVFKGVLRIFRCHPFQKKLVDIP